MKPTLPAGLITSDMRFLQSEGYPVTFSRGTELLIVSASVIGFYYSRETQNTNVVKVTVESYKLVPGTYHEDKLYVGYEARGDDGHKYHMWWDRRDENDTEHKLWYREDPKGEVSSTNVSTQFIWRDITYVLDLHVMGKRMVRNEIQTELMETARTKYPHVAVEKCKVHHAHAFYYTRDGCWACKYDIPADKTENEA